MSREALTERPKRELLALLEARLASGMRFYEFREGALHGEAASARMRSAGTAPHGAYLVARAPNVPELWAALRTTLATGVPLLLLPPLPLAEESLLLAQLPPSPPAESALVLFHSDRQNEPRAVFHSERSLLASARQLAMAFPQGGAMAALLPAWGMSGVIFHCLLPALRGSDLLFSEQEFASWAAHAGKLFGELEIDLLTLTPSLLEAFHREGLEHGWRGTVISLAAPLQRAALARYALAAGRRPLEIYGMKEAAGPLLLNGRSLGAETRISSSYILEARGEQMYLGYGAGGEFLPAPEWFATGDIFTDEDGLLLHQAREPVSVR